MADLPYALQLYTVRDHTERDFPGTLLMVKEAGYDYVELAGTGGMAAKLCAQTLTFAQLEAVAGHFSFEDVAENRKKTLADATTLGLRRAVVPWLGGDAFKTLDDWAAAGEVLEAAAQDFAAKGIQLCYHNHAHEFQPLDGGLPFDALMAAAPSVAAELDVYWIRFAGADPLDAIKKYAGRCPLLHIKDMSSGADPTFIEVGRGIIEWPPIFEAGRAAGVEWFIVEQDECEGDSLESAAISAGFMQKPEKAH